MNIWIVVADSAQAQILTTETSTDTLCEEAVLVHPESRLQEQELTSDQPGRAFDSTGMGRHAMSKSVDPKKQELIIFSKQVAEYLEAARHAHRFDKLYVLAAPAFLGHLRDHFSPPLSSTIAGSIDKNLVGRDIAEIRSHLPEFL